jgi:hypothetical protein
MKRKKERKAICKNELERSEAHASRSHNNQSKNTARRFMMEGRHVEKGIRGKEEICKE